MARRIAIVHPVSVGQRQAATSRNHGFAARFEAVIDALPSR